VGGGHPAQRELARIALLRDDVAGARGLIEEAQRKDQVRSNPVLVFTHRLFLSELDDDAASLARNEPGVREAITFFQENREPSSEAIARLTLARLLHVAKRGAEARAQLARVRALLAGHDWPVYHAQLEALAARIDPGEAQLKRLDVALAAATRNGLLWRQLDLRVARAVAEVSLGHARDRARLRALAEEARAKGFVRLAREVDALMSLPPG
jgi:hypothetical protein